MMSYTITDSNSFTSCHNTLTLLQGCSLETLVLVSRRFEDMKNGLGLGLEIKDLVLVLVLKKKSYLHLCITDCNI